MLKDFALEEPCSMTFDLVAKAKLLVADLLQQRMFDMTTARTFLHGLADTSSSHNEGGGFSLTPLELVIDACRLFTKLADHKKVLEMSLNQDQQGDLLYIHVVVHLTSIRTNKVTCSIYM